MEPLTSEILDHLKAMENDSEDVESLWQTVPTEGPMVGQQMPVHFRAKTFAGALYLLYKFSLKNYTVRKKINGQKVTRPLDILEFFPWSMYLEDEGDEPTAEKYVAWIVETCTENPMCQIAPVEVHEVVSFDSIDQDDD